MVDDPTENVADWFRLNSRPIGIAAGVLVLLLILAGAWRISSRSKLENANAALFAAQSQLTAGDAAGAQRQLETVANAYAGTPAGAEARLLLARLLFEQGKHAAGLEVLQKAGDVPDDLRSPIQAMTAAGFEATGKYADAAKAYEAAATAARFPVSKARYRADAARAFQLAGDKDSARRIWEELSKDDKSGLAEEAKVRLGELTATRAAS